MRLPAKRMQLLRWTFKPPNTRLRDNSCPRQFSFRHPRLLLATHQSCPRAQLPFLYPSGQHLSNGRVLRLFSINASQKKFVKETANLTLKYTIIVIFVLGCFNIAALGVLSERQEREFPSPHEWSLYTRFRFRRGKWLQIPWHNDETGFTNWARVNDELRRVLLRLEDPSKDGEGVVEQEDGGILLPGLGKTGLDITAKSGEWRQGYFEVLMGMATAGEHMDGWITTKSQKYLYPPEFIESPTNPRPKAVYPGMPEVPDPEDRIPVTDPPEKNYLKILTTKGFTTKQRLTAAIAYADWLTYKELPESAEETYRWALDIAISGLSTPDPSTVINRETGILSANAPKELITPNIIDAATNLATFHATHGNVTAALPIFISALRARLNADPGPPYIATPDKDSSVIGTITSLLQEPEYPPLPPTGDETLVRAEKDRCEEAALRNYIGEILFATAGSSDGQRKQGLNWIRDGVSTSKIAQSLDPIRADDEMRKKCERCEEVGLESWGKIMSYMAHEARVKRDAAKAGGFTGFLWKLWGTTKLDQDVENLEDEEEGVVMRLNKVRRKMLNETYADMDRHYARTFAF